MEGALSADQIAEYEAAFEMIDCDQNGKIDIDELEQVMEKLN